MLRAGWVFASPKQTIAGTAALAASIAGLRRAFPAAVVSFGSADEHGGLVRAAWVTLKHRAAAAGR